MTPQDGRTASTAFVLDDSDTEHEPRQMNYGGSTSSSSEEDEDDEEEDEDNEGAFIYDCTRMGNSGEDEGESLRRILYELEQQRVRVYNLYAQNRSSDSHRPPSQRRHFPPNP